MEEEAQQASYIEHHEMEAFAGVPAHGNLRLQHSSALSDFSVTSCTISYSRFAKGLLYVLVLVTCAPLIAGGAFTSIFIEDENYVAAAVSCFATCMSLGTLSLFCLHLCGRIERVHDNGTLSGLKLLGMMMSVCAGVSLGVDVILAFINKQAFAFYGMNFFSAAVFSGVWLATSMELYIVALWYQSAIRAPATSNTDYRMPGRLN